MLVKVDLHPDVVWFIRHNCSEEEQLAFARAVSALRTEPISRSESLADPQLSPFMLRFFRFAKCLAIFEYDLGRNKLKVLQCRRVRPSRRPHNLD